MGFNVGGTRGDMVRACLKWIVVFLALQGWITAGMAGTLLRLGGLVHA